MALYKNSSVDPVGMDFESLRLLISQQNKEIIDLRLRVKYLEERLGVKSDIDQPRFIGNDAAQPTTYRSASGSTKDNSLGTGEINSFLKESGNGVDTQSPNQWDSREEVNLREKTNGKAAHPDQMRGSSVWSPPAAKPTGQSEPDGFAAEAVLGNLGASDLQAELGSNRDSMRRDRLIHALTTRKLEHYLKKAQECAATLKDLTLAGPGQSLKRDEWLKDPGSSFGLTPDDSPLLREGQSQKEIVGDAQDAPSWREELSQPSFDSQFDSKLQNQASQISHGSQHARSYIPNQIQETEGDAQDAPSWRKELSQRSFGSQFGSKLQNGASQISHGSHHDHSYIPNQIKVQPLQNQNASVQYNIWDKSLSDVSAKFDDAQVDHNNRNMPTNTYGNGKGSIPDACVWLVKNICELLGTEFVKDLLPLIEDLAKVSKQKFASQKFVRRICEEGSRATKDFKALWPKAIEDCLDLTAYTIYGWPFEKQEHDSLRLGLPGLHLSLVTPRNFQTWFGVLLRDHAILLKLQSSNLSVAHSVISSCMQLAGVSRVVDIGPGFEDLSRQIENQRNFFTNLKSALGLPKHTKLFELERILLNYLNVTTLSILKA